MATWLNKLFNLRPNEWMRVLLFSAILVLTNIVETWALTTAYAEFTRGLGDGLETLTWVMVLSSIFSIISLSIYSVFVDRIDNNRLFIYVIIAGGGTILLSMVLVKMNLPKLAFPMLYVFAAALGAVWNSQFFTYLNELFDFQSIKRTLPLILGIGRIGSAVGGFTLGFLRNYLTTEQIIWIWLITDILIIGIIWVMPFVLKEQKNAKKESPRPSMSDAQSEKPSYKKSLRAGWDFTVQSGFLRWVAVGTLLLTALVTFLEYYINALLAPQFASSKDYASFLGLIQGISNVAALVILLFALSRMTKAWGIGNTSMSFPIISFFICSGLIVAPYLIPVYIVYVAALAHINRTGLRFSLQSSIESLLYNAVPLRIKGRARAFVGGVIGPLGGIVATLVLLVQLSYGSAVPWLLPSLIGILSLAYLISAFAVRYQYTQALVKMLEEEDYSFLLSGEASQLSVADPATLRRLEKKLAESSSHEMRVFMTQLIAQVGGAESLSVLIPAIKAATESRTRAAMLSVVAAAGLQGGKIRDIYADFLQDPDPQVRQSAASGLEQLLGSSDTWLQGQWLKMLDDTDKQISLYALQSLAATGGFYKIESATQKLDQLFKSDALEDKKSVINILGVIAQPKAIDQILFFLEDHDDQVRIEAVLSLENLVLPFGGPLDANILEKVSLLLSDPVARVRQAALKVIGKFKTKTTHPMLISALMDSDPQVCSAVVSILVGKGKDIIPAVQAELDSSNPQVRKMAAAVLCSINPRQFNHLVDKSISDNLNQIYRNIGLEQALISRDNYSSVRILLAALRESNHALIDQALFLLSAVHDPQMLKIIGESLHSDLPETRNLALEALESLTSPQTAALIASLFEPSIPLSQLLQLGQGSLNIEQPGFVQALVKLISQSESRIFDLLALHVAGEVVPDLFKIPDVDSKQSGVSPDEIAEIHALLEKEITNPDPLIRQLAQIAIQKISGKTSDLTAEAVTSLSLVEKMGMLKEVPFFRTVPISQIEGLAIVCEEKKYNKGDYVFKTGDSGGSLYILADGQVNIEQEKRGAVTLLATLGNNSYFGEMSLFDNSPRSTSVSVTKDSVVLELNRAPVFTLTMQSPDLAFELINVLSQRIRQTSDRLADTARSRPRELHKLFDQFE